MSLKKLLSQGFTITTPEDRFPDMIVYTDETNVTGAFTVYFTSTLATSDFVLGDITVTNGSAGTFTTIDSKNYSALITPTVSGSVTVKVNGASYTSSGYPNKLSNTLSVTYSSGGVDARLFVIGGQSNVIPGGNRTQQLASYLQSSIDAFIWNNATQDWDIIQVDSSVGRWPILGIAYWLKQKYPNDELYFVQHGKSGTNLYTEWSQGGNEYNTLKGYYDSAVLTLTDRNFLQKSFVWIQGEADSKVLIQANAYETETDTFVDAIRTDFDVTLIADCGISHSLPLANYPYRDTVITAKENYDATDANYYLLDTTTLSYQADLIHLNEDDIDAIGQWIDGIL